jgi:hypothetical protein
MLGQARPAHPDVEFVEAGLTDLPFEEGQFDGVFAWYSIIHTPSTELTEVFAEFRFLAQAQLDRGPRAGEQDDQGFVLARRV